jgi:AcrR family transcriptional regulator
VQVLAYIKERIEAMERDGAEMTSGADETRQRILEAAARVFAEQGYARATTRSLAAAAGVNEVTLFRHFGSKQNLFAAVTEQFAWPGVAMALEGLLITGDYHQDLLSAGKKLLRLLLERKDLLRLMLCEAAHFPEVQAVMVENPRLIRRGLADYFQQQMERGQVRPLRPQVMAQAFAGMLFSYAVVWGILEDSIDGELSTEELVGHFVDIFVHGTIRQA